MRRFIVLPAENAPFQTSGEHYSRTIEGEFHREDEQDK
jgi:hypothetical protein